MKLPFFILSELLLYTPQQAIDFVSYSAKKYTHFNIREIKQVATLSLYSQNATFPIEKKSEQIKKMFRDVSKFVRSEKKHNNFLEIVDDIADNITIQVDLDEISSFIKDIKLTKLENEIIVYLIKGYTITDILDKHKITYKKFNNIIKSIKRKSDLHSIYYY